ncbi:MAG: hypothetical protein ACFBZ8_08485 [Opitutales bacterium]
MQKRLSEEFQISMTYMDVRFLVDDLDLSLASPDPAPTPDVTEADAGPAADAPASDGSTAIEEPELLDEPGLAGGAVSVYIDRVQRPGAVLSGSVTFSDGVTAQWQVDQFGQLGVIPPESKSGYRPSEADLRDFQTALQREMQKSGF